MTLLIILTILFNVINIGMLISSGFSVYLMTQSLESHNPDKINGPSKVNSHITYCFMYSKTILTTRDTGVPNHTIPPTDGVPGHNGVLILIDTYCCTITQLR